MKFIKTFFIALILMVALVVNGASYTNTVSGKFSAGSTWAGGVAPSLGGDSWFITNNTTVIYDVDNSATVGWGQCSNAGTLYMSNGLPFYLLCSNAFNWYPNGKVQLGNPDNAYSYNSTNIASGIIQISNGVSCYNNGTNAFNIYGDTSHNTNTFFSYACTNGQTNIVVSNLPPVCVSNDIIVMCNSNGTVSYAVVASVVTNATYPYSNSVFLKQNIGSETNTWTTSQLFTNKLSGNKTVGMPVAFVNSPIAILLAKNQTKGNSTFIFTNAVSVSNTLQGFRTQIGGNSGSTFLALKASTVNDVVCDAGSVACFPNGADVILNSYFLNNGYAIFGSSVIPWNYMTNCYSYGGFLTGNQSTFATIVNCGIFAAPGSGYAISSSLYTLIDGLLFEYPSSGSQYGIGNGSSFMIRNLYVVFNGQVIPLFWAGYNLNFNGVTITNVSGNVSTTAGILCNGSYSVNAVNITTSMTNFLFSGFNIKAINVNAPSNLGNDVVNFSGTFQPIQVNNRFNWYNGVTTYTNGIYYDKVTSSLTNTQTGANILSSVRPNANRTFTIICFQTNNSSYSIFLDQGTTIPSLSTTNAFVPAATSGGNTNIQITYNNTNSFSVPLSLWVIDTGTNGGQFQVNMGQDNQLKEF